MMDHELLRLAAKASGRVIAQWNRRGGEYVAVLSDGTYWQPLLVNGITDCDGDAARLAVQLDIWPYLSSEGRIGVWRMHADGKMRDIPGVDGCWFGGIHPVFKPMEATKEAATRRAVVRAAAEIGKGMP
jgi:hypothetical protein